MDGIIHNIFKIILSVEIIVGSLGNGFIALVNSMDWVKRRKISSVDGILTALAISRIGVFSSLPTSILLSVSSPGLLMTSNMMKMIVLAWVVTNHFNLWLSTSLGIFYFLKIANFSNSIFLCLRWRVKKVVSVTMLVSLIFLSLNVVLINTHIDGWDTAYEGNLSHSSVLINSVRCSKFLYLINSLFMLIPFTVSTLAFFLLIFSLWKHLKRMQHNARGSRDASTTAHVKALQTVIAFLLLHTMFLFSRVIQMSNSELMNNNLVFFISLIIGAAFPSGHSFVLILRTQKLKQASRSVLWRLRSKAKDVRTLIKFRDRYEYS